MTGMPDKTQARLAPLKGHLQVGDPFSSIYKSSIGDPNDPLKDSYSPLHGGDYPVTNPDQSHPHFLALRRMRNVELFKEWQAQATQVQYARETPSEGLLTLMKNLLGILRLHSTWVSAKRLGQALGFINGRNLTLALSTMVAHGWAERRGTRNRAEYRVKVDAIQSLSGKD